ncbi:hypothetical protein EV121DRAFT_297905 [Schizophyllum commune]
MPAGPESISLDISFPHHPTVYGIPQHATALALATTVGEDAKYSDPFRLYNADVFEYLADSPMSLYGSIPVMYAHSAESTVGEATPAMRGRSGAKRGRGGSMYKSKGTYDEGGLLLLTLLLELEVLVSEIEGDPSFPAFVNVAQWLLK